MYQELQDLQRQSRVVESSNHFSSIAKITHDLTFICRSNEYGLPLGLTKPRYCVPVGTSPNPIRVNGSDDIVEASGPPLRPLAIPVPMMKGMKLRARSAVFPFCAVVNLYEPRGARDSCDAYSPALHASNRARQRSIHQLGKSCLITITSAIQSSTRGLSSKD